MDALALRSTVRELAAAFDQAEAATRAAGLARFYAPPVKGGFVRVPIADGRLIRCRVVDVIPIGASAKPDANRDWAADLILRAMR